MWMTGTGTVAGIFADNGATTTLVTTPMRVGSVYRNYTSVSYGSG